jgi:hypothetical protein
LEKELKDISKGVRELIKEVREKKYSEEGLLIRNEEIMNEIR